MCELASLNLITFDLIVFALLDSFLNFALILKIAFLFSFFKDEAKNFFTNESNLSVESSYSYDEATFLMTNASTISLMISNMIHNLNSSFF